MSLQAHRKTLDLKGKLFLTVPVQFSFMHIVRAELLLGGCWHHSFWFHRNWPVASAQSLARVRAHGPKCAYMRVDRQSPTCNFFSSSHSIHPEIALRTSFNFCWVLSFPLFYSEGHVVTFGLAFYFVFCSGSYKSIKLSNLSFHIGGTGRGSFQWRMSPKKI